MEFMITLCNTSAMILKSKIPNASPLEWSVNMLDKVEYWLELADDDIATAKWLLKGHRLLHTAYFSHLIAEKALKATVANHTNKIPPKTHNLSRLAELANISAKLGEPQHDLLERLTPFQIEGRYPEDKESLSKTLTLNYCKQLLSETEAFLCWIKQELGK